MHYSVVPMRQLLQFLFVQYISKFLLWDLVAAYSFTSLRRSYRMVQDPEQVGEEAHEAHQKARVS